MWVAKAQHGLDARNRLSKQSHFVAGGNGNQSQTSTCTGESSGIKISLDTSSM